MRVKMQIDMSGLRALRSNAEAVLSALDFPLRDAARRILDVSLFLVPRGGAPDDPVNLADTAFLDGPHHTLDRRMTTTWTCGYAHHAAGAIHQGWHFGDETKPPPNFLRRSVRGVGRELKKKVGVVFMQQLAKYAPKE